MTSLGTMREISLIIGVQGANNLTHAFSKQNLYICKNPDCAHDLKDILSCQALFELCRCFGGTTVYIPSAKSYRNQRIREAGKSKTTRQLAVEYQLSQRMIQLILSTS